MKHNLDAELFHSAIEHDWSYLRPVTLVPFWRWLIDGIIFAIALSALLYGLLWLASIGAL